jgi:hypothetical protein
LSIAGISAQSFNRAGQPREDMDTATFHLCVGWVAGLFGAVAGGAIGLFFHRDSWAGGYTSFRRRMLRLGHVSFFGIGFLNLFFGLSLEPLALQGNPTHVASWAFLIAVVLMPATCFLTAWKPAFRHLFPLPVLAILIGIASVIVGVLTS